MRMAAMALMGLVSFSGWASESEPREPYFGGLGTLGFLDDSRAGSDATGLELIYGRRPAAGGLGYEANLFGAIQETGNQQGTDFYRWGLGGDLTWAFERRWKVVPFALAGAAVARNDVQPNALDSWDWSANLGVGAVSQRIYGGMFRLRGEVRGTYDSYQDGFLDYLVGFGVELKLGAPIAPATVTLAEPVRVVPVASCPTATSAIVDSRGCEIGEVTRLEGVTFEFDKVRLRPDAKTILADVADTLDRYPELQVEIAGHTDNYGSEEYNLQLSQARADAVRQALIEHGVDGTRITAVGYGELEPVADNESDDGREFNRRVEMRIKNLPARTAGGLPR